MDKVKAGLRGLNAEEKLVKGRIVLSQLEGNPAFPNPTPSTADLKKACDWLEAANIAALDRGRMACENKRQAVANMERTLTRLAGYVNSVCMGDTTKLIQSGFDLVKRAEPISTLHEPREVVAKPTAFTGQLEVQWKRVPGALIYEVEELIGDEPDRGSWHRIALSSRPWLVVDKRNSGQVYTYRVCAIGTKVQSPYSDMARAKAV